MVVALVLDNDLAFEAGGGVRLLAEGHVRDELLEGHRAADFGQDGDGMRVPLGQRLARGHFFVLLDQQDRAGLDDVFVQLAPALVHDVDFGVAVEHDVFVLVVDHRLHVGELDRAGAAAAHFGFFHRALSQTADVEGAHGELRARLAHRLRRDDADRRADLHQRAGGEVHAVARARRQP